MASSENFKIALLIGDKYLKQKLSLMLFEDGKFVNTSVAAADAVLTDRRHEGTPPGALLISKQDDADIRLPLSFRDIENALTLTSSEAMRLDAAERMAYIGAYSVKLTELEFALLSLLYERGGFVTREEILDCIWGNGKDEGIVNVYIHYLRQKLEKNGEKLIISSRKSGYKIADRYKKGGRACEL